MARVENWRCELLTASLINNYQRVRRIQKKAYKLDTILQE